MNSHFGCELNLNLNQGFLIPDQDADTNFSLVQHGDFSSSEMLSKKQYFSGHMLDFTDNNYTQCVKVNCTHQSETQI